jgi:hypothetical protein
VTGGCSAGCYTGSRGRVGKYYCKGLFTIILNSTLFTDCNLVSQVCRSSAGMPPTNLYNKLFLFLTKGTSDLRSDHLKKNLLTLFAVEAFKSDEYR